LNIFLQPRACFRIGLHIVQKQLCRGEKRDKKHRARMGGRRGRVRVSDRSWRPRRVNYPRRCGKTGAAVKIHVPSAISSSAGVVIFTNFLVGRVLDFGELSTIFSLIIVQF
jgi:hypothetical protein